MRSLIMAALFAAGLSFAQSGDAVTVRLPFAAQVADQVLPAGDYDIRVLSNGSDIPSLIFRSEHASFVVAANRVPIGGSQIANHTGLVLVRTGDGMALRKLLIDGRSYCYELQ